MSTKKITHKIHKEILLLSKTGLTNAQITEAVNALNKSEFKENTVRQWKTKPLEDVPVEENTVSEVIDFPSDDFDVNKLSEDAFKKTVWFFHHMADTAQKEIKNTGETNINYKALAEVAEKVVRYQSTAQKSNLGTKGVGELDKDVMRDMWRMSAELFVSAKKQGVDYDEKAHIKDLLDKITGKHED